MGVSGYWLTPNEHFGRDDDDHDQHAEVDFYSDSYMKQQSL